MRKFNISKELLKELYCGEQMTTYQIAEELGVSRQTICNKLRDYDISIRDSRFKSLNKKKLKKLKKEKKYKDKEEFDRVYKELKSLELVAEYFGINQKTAYIWKNKLGIETVKEYSNVARGRRMEGKPWADKEYLAEMYEKYSTFELAKMWNCHPTTLQKQLKKYGIKSKDVAEQWARKSKNGIVVVKDANFDLQAYKEQIVLSEHLSKKALAYIKSIVGKCQSCGYDKVLDLHHIDEDHTNNDPENHVILCPNCHALIHRMGKTVEEICPDYESWADILEESYSEAK